MLVSLWLVPGRFFRSEYMRDWLLLLPVLNVRVALVGVGAAAPAVPTARGCLVAPPGGAAPALLADDDATSTSSSSSARSRRAALHLGEESERLARAQRRKRGVCVC